MPDRKYTTLRKRLDQLGYRQPLVIEAVPLVEKLFSDLVHTTESFKNYKSRPYKLDESTAGDLSEPYKNDNSRLIKENNELHKELIKCKDEVEKLSMEMKSALNKLENENHDLKFLNTQYVSTIKNVEKESKQKSEHILSLEEKNMNAVVETPGGRKKSIPFRRQRMDIESTLPHSDFSASFANDSKVKQDDPYVVDLLTVADNQMENLKQDISKLQSDNSRLDKQCRIYKKQVESREREIERLNRVLDGGRPAEAIAKDVKSTSNNKVLSHLNIQVDYLQQANRDLEKKLSSLEEVTKTSSTKAKDLKERNDELCMELAAMQKTYKNLGKERKKNDYETDEQMARLQSQVDQQKQTIVDLQSGLHNIKKERDGLIEENQQINITLKDMNIDKDNLLHLYEKCENEKRRLAERNARLTVSERELAMELERVKISKGVLPKKSTDQLRYLIRNLEDDRDHYKSELESLQKLIHQRLFSKSNIRSENKDQEGNAIIQLLQEERDYFKKEYELLRSTGKSHPSPPSKDRHTGNDEFSRVQRERDELQKMLETFEKHLAKITENVKSVTTERNNMQMLYEQAIDEVQRLRRKQTKGFSPSGKITSILEKAEKERDEALFELRKARSEIHNMKFEIKQIQKTYENERAEYYTQQRDAEELLDKMDNDKNALTNRMSSTQSIVHSLESQLSKANKIVRKHQEDLFEKESEISKVKLLLEESEKSKGDLQTRLEERLVLCGEMEEANNKLHDDIAHFERRTTEYEKEISRLKSVAATLDRERDVLQKEVDDKTEDLLKLDDRLLAHEKDDTELKLSLEELEENLRYREEELGSRDREISSLEKQLHSFEQELAGISKARETTIRENKRILDDLTLMTEDNQDIHQQLRDRTNECQALKQQMEDYTMHVGRIEEMLAQKEVEKEELLVQYKTLNSKAIALESNAQQSEDDHENAKQDLVHCQQEVTYLQERCSVLEDQIEQHISNEEKYENQINNLIKSVNELQNQVNSTSTEKETVIGDLYAVRELCVRLDQTRGELTKKLAEKTTQHEKLEEFLIETRAESDALKSQVVEEVDTVRNLEKVISSTREKQILEKSLHERESLDYDRVKSELERCQRDRNNQEREVKNLRKQNTSLLEEVDLLKNRLTGEKYELERIRQEYRRQSSSPEPRREKTTTTSYSTNETTASSIIGKRKTRNVVFSPLQVSFSSEDGDETA